MKTRRLAWLLPCLLFSAPNITAAQETNQAEQLQILEQRIEQLEQQARQQTPTAKATNTAENTGNPSISVIGTFAGAAMNSSNGGHSSRFFPLSEGEFVFAADVDAYTRLDVTVTAANGAMAVEEGYLTASMPQGFRLRAGRKFIPFGIANETHPHALVYADRPNALVNLFGADKLIGEGMFVDHPLYLGDSAHTFLVGFFQSANPIVFNPAGSNRFGGMARWSGMWDVHEDSTLELGATFINSGNGIAGNSRTNIFGLHFSLKNTQTQHRGWALQGEWNRSQINKGKALPATRTDGSYILGEYDFNRHWLGFARYDFSHINAGVGNESAYSAGLGWKLSEFQSLTLQYKRTQNLLPQTALKLGIAAAQNAHELFFRWVLAIGPHRPHSY